jgi:hypothetical protein
MPTNRPTRLAVERLSEWPKSYLDLAFPRFRGSCPFRRFCLTNQARGHYPVAVRLAQAPSKSQPGVRETGSRRRTSLWLNIAGGFRVTSGAAATYFPRRTCPRGLRASPSRPRPNPERG